MTAELRSDQLTASTIVVKGTNQTSNKQKDTSAVTTKRVDFSDPDIVDRKTGKTLYEVGVWEIVWRNFLAGMSRGLGNLILLIIFSLVIGNLFMTYIWPHLSPLVDNFYSSSQLFNFVEQNFPTGR